MSGDEFDAFLDDDPIEVVEGEVEETVEAAPKTEESKPAVQPKETGLATFDFNTIDLGLGGAGVIVAETGTKVSRFPIERIKFTANKKERISIILDKVVIVKTHFHDDIGSVLCNGSYCCEALGLPSVRYVFPVVHYLDTDKKGTIIGKDIDVKVLAVGKDNYEELLTIMENKGNLSQFDIVVTCNDENYQKCSFTEAGQANWKRSKKSVEYVTERLTKDGKNMVACIGRTMTDSQIKKALGVDEGPSLAENVNMDAIFGDD